MPTMLDVVKQMTNNSSDNGKPLRIVGNERKAKGASKKPGMERNLAQPTINSSPYNNLAKV